MADSLRGMRPGFVVVRVDPDAIRLPKSKDELDVIALAAFKPLYVFWSRDDAIAEAQRLNEVNRGKACYFVHQVKADASIG